MKTLAILACLVASAASADSTTIRSPDGKNQAAVKAASTAAGASDPALVIAVSPNNTVAVTESGAWTVAQSGSWTVGQSGTWTVQPGNTANTTPWLIKGSDGTNSWSVKAASTAAGATDTALVVAVSPNNTVAVTQSGTWNVGQTGTWNVGQTGTWTVQPGNTANTTAWLVTQGGNGATLNAQASVTTTAAALASASSKTLCLKALTANTDLIYLGSSSGVTSANGFPMYPGDSWCGSVSNANLVFAISGSGTQTLAEFGTN